MLAFYYLENHISVRHFDHTIFEGVIVLFDLHYFIRMWVEGGGVVLSKIIPVVFGIVF